MVLNKCNPEGAIVKLGEYDRIPMYSVAMPPLYPYKTVSPDIEYLKEIFIGLLEAFPSYSQDFFMYYLYTKQGIKSNYTVTQLAKIALKERPTSGEIIRASSGLCNNSDSDKENISYKVNNAVKHKKHFKARNRTKEIIPKVSNEILVIDKMKANLLQKIEERSLPASKLFTVEDCEESLKDEGGYTPLDSSAMKELSDLDKESIADGLNPKNGKNNNEEAKSDSFGIGNDLYCTENINDEKNKSHL